MTEPQMVDPHSVVMTGENSFIRLSGDGGKTIVDRVSHRRAEPSVRRAPRISRAGAISSPRGTGRLHNSGRR
jgi:hypothetical protein